MKKAHYVLIVTRSEHKELDWESRILEIKSAMMSSVEDTLVQKISALSQQVETLKKMSEASNRKVE